MERQSWSVGGLRRFRDSASRAQGLDQGPCQALSIAFYKAPGT
jgi:hypothetical protein